MKKFIQNFEQYTVAFLLASMTVLTVVNVFFRYVLKSSLNWVHELTIIIFAWLIFLGASWAVRVGAHIGMESFVNLFQNKTKRIFALVAVLCCLTYSVIILIGSYTYVEKIYTVGILSQDIKWLPQWIPRLIMPLGYGLLIFRFLQVFLNIITGKQYGLNLLDEAKETVESFKKKGSKIR
jgi:C4-dicarboxylate transporter DctQ subunit